MVGVMAVLEGGRVIGPIFSYWVSALSSAD